MKAVLAAVLLVILFVPHSQAQNVYSEQNLKLATTEDLNLYLTKAKKQKKIGGALLIATPISAALGVFLWADAWRGRAFSQGELVIGSGLIIAAAGAPIIGFPVRIIGTTRVNRVSGVLNERKSSARIGLAPCTLINYQTKSIHPGIGIRITI